jgi:hypothetical protein
LTEPVSAGFGKLLATLLTGGLGPLFAPMQSRRMGLAEAHNHLRKRLADAQADKDIEEIKAGRKFYDPRKGELLDVQTPARVVEQPPAIELSSASVQNFLNDISSVRVADELKRTKNLFTAIDFAREEIEQESEVPLSDDPVDPDWFEKWRLGAESISRQDILRIWGRLLGKEVRAPGSFHLRTIEALRTLTSSDAELITKVLAFAIGGQTLLRDLVCFSRNGIGFGELMELEEIGILGSVDAGSGREMKWGVDKFSFSVGIPFGGELGLLVVLPADSPAVKVPSIPLTRVGRELYSLGTFVDPPIDYIQEVANSIKRDNAGAMVQLSRKSQNPNGSMSLIGWKEL